jgi:SET domain-containing protein 6
LYRYIVAKLEQEGAKAGKGAGYTFDTYLAARSVVSSRAFTINPVVGVGLVPIADLFNHRTGGHHVHMCDLDDKLAIPEIAKQEGGEARGGKEGDCMFMKVVTAVDEGEEVFNTYGELGNAKLLCSYGFAQMNNPADDVTIGLPALRAAAALRGVSGAQIAARLAWCEANGVCDEETAFHLRARSRSVPSDALLLVLWILATSDGRFDAVRKAMKPPSDKGNAETVAHFTSVAEKQGGTLKEESALQILSETLRRRRAMYAASAPEDGGSDDWKSSLSILLNSEEGIIRDCEKYLEENVKSDDGAGENRKRKVDGGGKPDEEGGQKAAADAFSLFD